MTKKVVMICIICFMLCMFIVPCLANVQTNAPGVNRGSVGSYKITENLKKEAPPLYTMGDKKNLTESQKKLSTALLLQTPALNLTAPLIRNASQSSLTMKNIPIGYGTSGIASASSNLPSGKLVYVYVKVNPGYSTHIIDSYAYEVPNRDDSNQLAVAWVDVQNLEALAAEEGVRSISEVTPPVVNIGSVTTQGDIIHKTADVRSKFGYSGAGMKIGIISDGVNHIADSKASGDLPSDVTVLSDTQGGDEGTAMLEIVHDMVPDAKLYFHDCGSNTLEFNAAVNELYANGCTVICDDIGWPSEPYFEDGIVASNVATLISNNKVIYVSSAGNWAQALYTPQGHYQGYFSPYSGYAPDYNYNDFSHGTDPNFHALYVYIPAGSTLKVFLEWNDQFGHSANDYDLGLFDYNTGSLLAISQDPQSGTQNPFEYLSITNTGGSTIVGQIEVYKYSGLWKNLELYMYTSGGAYVYTNNLVASDSIFGQPAVPNVIAVAAVPASDPSTIEPFSSRGPVTISYPSAVSRSKPDISGVDGVAVTGVGGFGSPFYGTSAAAPHVAAVVAQIWGAHPTLSAAQVRSALYTSAVDLGATGKDTTFGYGRADALAMEGNTVKIGVFRPSTHMFYLQNGTTLLWTTTIINWGASTDLPVTGDWNGDGITDIGVFRPSTHMFYLKNGTATSWTTTTVNWGASTDLPVTGDWNGDGITDIGVFRPSTHMFYLKNGTATSWTTTTINWGASTDRPVTGDWNSDGITDIGVFRPSTHMFYLKNGTATSWTTTTINWGASTDLPVTGDWNSDGITDIGVFRPSTHMFYLKNGNATSWTTMTINWGASTDLPVTGDWIGTPVPPVARFSGTPATGTAPLTVTFTDLSLRTPTSWTWSFGDGNTSTLKNPSNVYSSPGLYTVSLTVTNSAGSNSTTKLNYINVTEGAVAPVAGFSATPTNGTAPLTVAFTDLSANSPTSWSWSFGDGNTSILKDPSNVYSSPGLYTVSLNATNSAGFNSTTKLNYINVTEGAVSLVGSSGTPTNGTAHLTVRFTNISSKNPTG
jgi:PKD repeat protein